MNVDEIDPRLLHFSQRVCDDDEDECMLNIGHTSNVMMMMKLCKVMRRLLHFSQRVCVDDDDDDQCCCEP